MTQFKALSLDELCQRLCQNKKTLIIYHIRSDADAVGSAFALKELLRLMGIPAVCACSDEVPDRLRFLSEDAQGSVVPEEGMSLGHERVISVDSASPAQLGDMFTALRRDVDIMIDHHGTGTVYADNYIVPTAAATGEIIYAVAKRLMETGQVSLLTPRFYTCVYAAISSDTGGFRFANVTPTTHRIAAELMESGIDTADVNHKLFASKSHAQLTAEGEAARRLKLWCDGRVASVAMPYADRIELGLSDNDMETVIDIPRSLAGVEVAFFVRQIVAEPKFRVSMRSSVDFDVSAVCRRFGGGGHVRASGCSIEAPDIATAEKMLVNAIIEQMKS